MDEKFIRRFESFKNSLDSLAEARQRDLSDSFVISGTSAKFSITFDLTWKVMKDILVQYYAITGFVTGSPREVLRQSFQANLITGDEWMDMLKIRNQLPHDYDGLIVKEHCQTIVNEYIDKMYEFKIAFETLWIWINQSDFMKKHLDLKKCAAKKPKTEASFLHILEMARPDLNLN